MSKKRIPHLDLKQKIPILPACIRFTKVDNHIWSIASINQEDYASLGVSSFREAREEGLVNGRMFKVHKWVEIE